MGDLMEYNGSAIVGMAGKECVGIACDKRLGINRFQTVSADFQKVFKINDKCFLGLAGLATDVQTVAQYMTFRSNLYELREERTMRPQVVSNHIGCILYSRRFAPYFVAPVVAGLDEKNQPVLTAFDFIGADCKAKDFVVNGTASEQLYGLCESFWKPDMDEEQLFETLSQCLMAGVDRDCVSGWGGVVHIITPNKIITRTLKGRQD